jgi:hypothetical protein
MNTKILYAFAGIIAGVAIAVAAPAVGGTGDSPSTSATGNASRVTLSRIFSVRSGKKILPAYDVRDARATCPKGSRVISGGGSVIAFGQLATSRATSDRRGWYVVGINESTLSDGTIEANAYCSRSGRAIASAEGDASSSRSTVVEEEIKAEVARIRAGM